MIKATHESALGNGGETVCYITEGIRLPKPVINKKDFPEEAWFEMYCWGHTLYITGVLV